MEERLSRGEAGAVHSCFWCVPPSLDGCIRADFKSPQNPREGAAARPASLGTFSAWLSCSKRGTNRPPSRGVAPKARFGRGAANLPGVGERGSHELDPAGGSEPLTGLGRARLVLLRSAVGPAGRPRLCLPPEPVGQHPGSAWWHLVWPINDTVALRSPLLSASAAGKRRVSPTGQAAPGPRYQQPQHRRCPRPGLSRLHRREGGGPGVRRVPGCGQGAQRRWRGTGCANGRPGLPNRCRKSCGVPWGERCGQCDPVRPLTPLLASCSWTGPFPCPSGCPRCRRGFPKRPSHEGTLVPVRPRVGCAPGQGTPAP